MLLVALTSLVISNSYALVTSPDCTTWRDDATPYSFTAFSPAPRQARGISIPRQAPRLFRGAEFGSPYLAWQNGVRAMLGDSSTFVESKALSHLSRALTGEEAIGNYLEGFDADDDEVLFTVGRERGDVEIELRDDDGRPVPDGEVGERRSEQVPRISLRQVADGEVSVVSGKEGHDGLRCR